MDELALPDHYAERVLATAFANGVFRITFGARGDDNAFYPTARVQIPAEQLDSVLGTMLRADRELPAKVAEAEATKASTAEAAREGVGDADPDINPTPNPESGESADPDPEAAPEKKKWYSGILPGRR